MQRSGDSLKPFADDKVKFKYLVHNDHGHCICQFFEPKPWQINQGDSEVLSSRCSSTSSLATSTTSALRSSRSSSLDHLMSPGPCYNRARSNSETSGISVSSNGSSDCLSSSLRMDMQDRDGLLARTPDQTSSGCARRNRPRPKLKSFIGVPFSNDQLMSPPDEMKEKRNDFMKSQIYMNPSMSLSQSFIHDNAFKETPVDRYLKPPPPYGGSSFENNLQTSLSDLPMASMTLSLDQGFNRINHCLNPPIKHSLSSNNLSMQVEPQGSMIQDQGFKMIDHGFNPQINQSSSSNNLCIQFDSQGSIIQDQGFNRTDHGFNQQIKPIKKTLSSNNQSMQFNPQGSMMQEQGFNRIDYGFNQPINQSLSSNNISMQFDPQGPMLQDQGFSRIDHGLNQPINQPIKQSLSSNNLCMQFDQVSNPYQLQERTMSMNCIATSIDQAPRSRSNLSWSQGTRHQRSNSEPALSEMENDQELQQILDEIVMDDTNNWLDESLSNALKDSKGSTETGTLDKKPGLAQIFNENSGGYEPKCKASKIKRRRTEQYKFYNFARYPHASANLADPEKELYDQVSYGNQYTSTYYS